MKHRIFWALAALAALALALGWAVVRARRWWVVLALTLPPLLPGLLADLYPRWPPFMALAACWCAMVLTDLCKWAAPSRRGALTLAALPAAGLALLAITLALPREGYTRPDWALRAEELYGSMLLRGFHGEFFYVDVPRLKAADLVYTAACAAAFFCARRFNIPSLLGSLFVR